MTLTEKEKDIVADIISDCTPLDKYTNLLDWWTHMKRCYITQKNKLKSANANAPEVTPAPAPQTEPIAPPE